MYNAGVVLTAVGDIKGTVDDFLYRSARDLNGDAGSLKYSIPVPSESVYHVRLHFAETDDDASETSRIFDVRLEGDLALEDFSIVAEKSTRRAVARSFSVAVTDGALDIKLKASVGEPIISGIEIYIDNGANPLYAH